MIETEIVIESNELRGSYEDARKMLAEALGSKEDYRLEDIIKLLKQRDCQLVQKKISDIEKKRILEAIWKYKILCNKNDAEDRTANTLNLFIKDIYKDSFHFFLELIQNADDASKGGDKHGLKITLDKDYNIIFQYDERGFNFSDIFSITSLGNSTKKAQLDDADIGEKGIGFKSIFAIVKEIDIKSKYFSFKIQADTNRLTNILQPAKVTLETSSNTILMLTLKDELKTDTFFNEIHNWMESNLMCKDFANPFLFLKNIKFISYLNENNTDDEISITIKKEKINEDFVHATIEDKNYIIYTENMPFSKQAIISRWKHLESELSSESDTFTINRPTQIAFPLIGDFIPKGKIYSYLPTNIEIKFPVFVNLDVHLTASRGNITKDDFATESIWNNQVEENLSQFLLNAYLKIVETHTNELQDNEYLKKLLETLYHYIPIECQNGSYATKLNEFKDEIKKEAIILTNENKFSKLDDIFYISSSFLKKYYDEGRLKALYQFIGSTRMENCYPKTLEWNRLVYDIAPESQSRYDAYDFVKAQKGIKKYWNNNQGNAKVLESIVKMLFSGISKRKEIKNIDIIPIECKENEIGFDLVSYNSIKKALFLHSNSDSNNEDIEDHDNSVYIYDDKNKIEGLKELVSKTYNIGEYNLTNYFTKKVDELGEEITKEGMRNFIDCTFRFYKNDTSCFNIETSPKVIKEFLGDYTLSSEDWNKCSNDAINESYVQAVANLDELNIWEITKDTEGSNQSLYINYLIFLGIKHKIEFVKDYIDDISNKVLEQEKKNWDNKKIPLSETNRKLKLDKIHTLQCYFLTQLNANVDTVSKDNLINLCKILCLFKLEDKKYMYKEKEIFILQEKKINKLNEEISELRGKNKETYSLEDSSFCIISEELFSHIWNKISRVTETDEGILTTAKWDNLVYKDKATIQNKFMNSFNWKDDNFLKDLRMTKILNKVFETNYAWGHEPLTLSLERFLYCYKELSNGEQLGNLMKAGYKVTLRDFLTAKDYLNKFRDLEEFLNSIKIFQGKNFNDVIDLSLFAIIENNLMKEDYIIFDNENNKTENIRYLLKKQEEKSALMFNILKACGIELYTHQKKEIQDYFGELIYKTVSPQELNSVGFTKYCLGVFFDFHEQNIEKGKTHLKSIWDKEILQQLCVPFELIDHTQMEGYSYTCPICGEKSLAALSGMKFSRFKQSNSTSYPYLHVVSCLNCNSMLKHAKSLEIQGFDEIMKDFKTCYCVDNNHIKNHSAMMTVTIRTKTWDGIVKYLPMKVSYLNMILYNKLYNK